MMEESADVSALLACDKKTASLHNDESASPGQRHSCRTDLTASSRIDTCLRKWTALSRMDFIALGVDGFHFLDGAKMDQFQVLDDQMEGVFPDLGESIRFWAETNQVSKECWPLPTQLRELVTISGIATRFVCAIVMDVLERVMSCVYPSHLQPEARRLGQDSLRQPQGYSSQQRWGGESH